MTKIVFDMGATNTRVAEVKGDALGEVLRRPTPENRNGWASYLLEMINEVTKGENVESVTGGVAGIRGREALVSLMSNARIYNDALLAGFGEALYGAGKDKEIVGYIGIGTGIGTARIFGRKIETAGFEAGHHVIDISNNRSWEEIVSGRVLKEKHQKYPQELERGPYNDYIKKIALGVYNSILFWSPEVIVMGGALINEKEGFDVEEIAKAVEEINEALSVLPPIRRSELGDNAGLYGAMALLD